jgi:hypothetical protein
MKKVKKILALEKYVFDDGVQQSNIIDIKGNNIKEKLK